MFEQCCVRCGNNQSWSFKSHSGHWNDQGKTQRNTVPIPCFQVEVTVRLEKLTMCSAAYEVPNFYITQIQLICLHMPNTSAYPEPDESSVRPLTLLVYDNFNRLLSAHLHPVGNWSRHLEFPSKTLYAFLISPMRLTVPPVPSSLIWSSYILWWCSLCNFLQSPVSASL
jgi:hypothetical protein